MSVFRARHAKSRNLPKFLDRSEWAKLILEAGFEENGGPKSGECAARDRAIVTLMLVSGLRLAEVCDLDLQDFTWVEKEERVFVRRGKGRKQRHVDLHPHAVTALKHYLRWRRDVTELDEVDGQTVERKPFFVSTYSCRISHRRVQRMVAAAGVQMGKPWLTHHKLRHSNAVQMWDKSKGDLFLVMTHLGHEDPNTTAIYAHVKDENRRNVTRKQ